MRQKVKKKIRREVKKYRQEVIRQFLMGILALPLRLRIKIAWMIIRRKSFYEQAS